MSARTAVIATIATLLATWGAAATCGAQAPTPAAGDSAARDTVHAAPAATAEGDSKTPGHDTAPAGRARPGNEQAPRTLDDVNIEGKIAVPQVLFIRARDQRRVLGFQHHRYLPTSQAIGEAMRLPTWIVLIAPPPSPDHKETTP